MNIQEVRDYCMQMYGVCEEFPFDDNTLVFKLCNKMFLLMPLIAEEHFIMVKCEPEQAVRLREEYAAVRPAWHMNKKHWNMIYIERDMPDNCILEWINHSYRLVYEKLPRRKRPGAE